MGVANGLRNHVCCAVALVNAAGKASQVCCRTGSFKKCFSLWGSGRSEPKGYVCQTVGFVNGATEASRGSTFVVLSVVCGAAFAENSKRSEPKEHVCRTVGPGNMFLVTLRKCGKQSEP
jgi:hypothetical protein